MHPTAERFAETIRERHGLEVEVEEFPKGTKTASDAADAIGCSVSQIVKSVVMMVDGAPVVVLTAGHHRVDESALATELDGQTARPADAGEVKSATGWSIGGVPPCCHEGELRTYIDPALLEHERVWAAAGTPAAVFSLQAGQLEKVSGATLIDVFIEE